MTDLYPFQREGAAWLPLERRALLADEMRLGKSCQAVRAAWGVGQILGRTPRIAVVCPATIIEHWRREFARWWPGFDQRCLDVLSYDGMADYLARRPALDVVVFDEGHRLKNRNSKRTIAAFGERCDGAGGLVEGVPWVFVLTGTPAPNNPSELWPMLRALFPEVIPNPARPGHPLPYWAFVSRYCQVKSNGFARRIVGGKARALPELRARMAPYVLRRRMRDVLKDLPPVRHEILPLVASLPPELLAAEDSADAAAIRAALDAHGIEGLERVAGRGGTLRRLTALAKVAPVLKWLGAWFAAGGAKHVVYAQHLEVLDALENGLRSFGTVRVDGAVPPKKRQPMADRFQEDPACRVFLGQIQAAGEGIRLNAASNLLLVEASWVPGHNQQVAARILGIGQHQPCTVRLGALAGSVDERVQEACVRKLRDAHALFG